MRAKEAAQPVAAIAADEPSEAGSTASELANVRRPEGLKWRAHGAKRSAQPRNTAQASAQGGAKTRSDHAELRGGNTASRQAQQGDHCELWIVYSPVHQLVKKSF